MSLVMTIRGVQHFITNLGIKHAPLEERDVLRFTNKRIAKDIAMSGALIPIYMILGAWKLVAISSLLALLGPAALVLNSLGYFRSARLVVAIAFGFCIAVINVMLGTWTNSEIFYLPGIASVYANFKETEKREKVLAILLITSLTVGSHFWSTYHQPVFHTDVQFLAMIKALVWVLSGVFLVSQIQILLETAKHSQKRLRDSEELYSAIFNLAGTGLNVMTPDGYYIKSNPEMCRVMGREESEMQTLRSVDITESGDRAQTLAEYQSFVSGEIDSVLREKVYIHKSGRRISARLQSRAIRNEQGGIKYFVTSVHDLTETRAAELKLLQSSKMSSLGEMAGSIAHEINTPLAIIQITAEQLETPEIIEQLSKEEVSSMAKTISDTVLRVASIVKGLKAFARNADQDPMERLSVKAVVEDSLTLCREKFKNHGIGLHVDIANDLEINCRATQISQVLVNLLNNAVDAIDAQKDHWVRVETSVLNNDVLIKVTDSGLGIPDAVADRILEPFFTTKAIGHGTGLGLSVSKGIIEAHGGRLFLDRASLNTSFVIEIPRAQAADAEETAA